MFHGKFKILNLNWTEDLREPKSNKFKSLAGELESDLATASSNLSSDSDLNVKVTKFLPGSVIVKFDIGKLPSKVDNIDKSDLKYKLLCEEITKIFTEMC